MAKTREIRKRIGSVRNIHKITRTMERVAQSKGMKLTGRFDHAKGFRAGLLRVLPEALGAVPGTLQGSQELADHPLGAERPETKRVLLFCITSSRGLCGAYNARVIQSIRARMRELTAEGKETALAVMGKKGLAYFRYHDQPVDLPIAEVDENVSFHRIDEIARDLMDRFVKRQVDAVEIISTRYRTRMQQEVRRVGFLPYRAAAGPGEARGPAEGPDGKPLYLLEPDRRFILDTVVPLLVKAELFCVVLEAMLCEQAQRSLAMRSATDNADSMTKQLTRRYNRARQAQITNEMIEIISGSEGGR